MQEVADLAGVGLKTVSRVVNRETGVSEEMAARVQVAVRQLGYRPDTGASSLRRADRRSSAIGVVVDDVANPFSAAVLRGIENVAMSHRTVVLVGSAEEDADRETEVVQTFVDRRVDGLIVAPSGRANRQLQDEVERGVPVVLVDRDAAEVPADQVVSTNELGSQAAVVHLADHGHCRIAFLGAPLSITTAQHRLSGYRRAVTGLSLEMDPRWLVDGLSGEVDAEGAVIALLSDLAPQQRPTALFCAQNRITIGAVRALQRLGLHRSVAVVGFDDFPLADLLEPGITVVAQEPARIGMLAAQTLFDRIHGHRGPARTIWVPTTLMRRGSGEIVPR